MNQRIAVEITTRSSPSLKDNDQSVSPTIRNCLSDVINWISEDIFIQRNHRVGNLTILFHFALFNRSFTHIPYWDSKYSMSGWISIGSTLELYRLYAMPDFDTNTVSKFHWTSFIWIGCHPGRGYPTGTIWLCVPGQTFRMKFHTGWASSPLTWVFWVSGKLGTNLLPGRT